MDMSQRVVVEGLSCKVTAPKSGYVVSIVEGLSYKDTEHRSVHAVSVV